MMLGHRRRRRLRAPRAPPARAAAHAGGGGAAAAAAEAWRPRGRARRQAVAPRGGRRGRSAACVPDQFTTPASAGAPRGAPRSATQAAIPKKKQLELATSEFELSDIDDVSASVARHRPAHGHTRSGARCRPRSARRQSPCSARAANCAPRPGAPAAPPLCGHPNEEDHSCQRGATQRCLPVTLHNVIVTPTVAARRRGCARAHSPRADLLHADLPRSAELPPPARADQPSTHRQRCGGRASCASRC